MRKLKKLRELLSYQEELGDNIAKLKAEIMQDLQDQGVEKLEGGGLRVTMVTRNITRVADISLLPKTVFKHVPDMAKINKLVAKGEKIKGLVFSKSQFLKFSEYDQKK